MHDCLQETRIALIERDVTRMAEQVSEMHAAIVGNGKPGIRVDTELNKTAIDRLWKAFYGVCGVLGTTILFFGGYLLKVNG